MLKNIKHIILDLGGVLLNIDYSLAEQAFIALGIKNFGALYAQAQQSPLFDDLETGTITPETFFENLRTISGIPLTNQQITTAWNAMLLDFPLRRLQLLQQLRLHFDLVLLSNTNAIHETAFSNILKDICGIPTLGALFDKVYFSHRAGMRKPDVATFQKVLDDCRFAPQHTLFIDDSMQHIEGAKKAGIQTIFLAPGMTIEKDIFLPKK